MIISRVISTIERSVQELIDGMNNKLTLEENLRAAQKSVVSDAVADTEFTVQHNLGKTPRHYIYNVDASAIVYDSRRSAWTENLMYLKCSQASVTITLTIL